MKCLRVDNCLQMRKVKEQLFETQDEYKLFPVTRFAETIRHIDSDYIAVWALSCYKLDYGAIHNVRKFVIINVMDYGICGMIT